jgi:hypothetical protein
MFSEKIDVFARSLASSQVANSPNDQEPVVRIYGVNKKLGARNLRAGEIALPKKGNCPVDFFPFLSDDLRTQLEDTDHLFSAERVDGTHRPARPSVMVGEPGEYPRVVKALKEVEMVTYTTTPPKVINGMFGVAKNTEADPMNRFITNAIPTNEHTRQLTWKLKLPDPGVLSRLPPWVEYVASTDIESYYNVLRIPESWRPWMGFPKVSAATLGLEGTDDVWPVSNTLPMGWTHSVSIGQDVHENLFRLFIRKMELKHPHLVFLNLQNLEEVQRAAEYSREQVVFYLIYVDDLSLFGLRKDVLDLVLSAVITFYDEHGFPVKLSKTVFAVREHRVLGVWLDLVGKVIRPLDSTWWLLYSQLPRLCRSKRPVQLRILQSLVGKMLWPALLLRPVLSIFHSVYTFLDVMVRRQRSHMVLWDSVRKELRCFWAILPLIQTRLVRLSRGAVASDATGTNAAGLVGIGVVYTPCFPVRAFSLEKWSPGVTSMVADVPWRWAVASSRKSDAPVHIQEMVGLLLACRVANSHGLDMTKRRLVLLNDNTTVVGSVNKGRSSSSSLNCLIRRFCGDVLRLSWNLPFLSYVPTKLNPADAPSRAFSLL